MILPDIIDQIINCKDRIAQEYLMEVLVTVFPAEYHYFTLDTLLPSLSLLHPDISLTPIVLSLIGVLVSWLQVDSSYLGKEIDPSIKEGENNKVLFELFWDHIIKLIKVSNIFIYRLNQI